MTDNIYKVEKESDLNEILLDKQDRLVVVMFTDHLSLDKATLRQMRLNIFELSQTYENVFFVYIDLQKFTETSAQQHTKDIKIPRFTFYYNCEDSGHVEGMDMNVLAKTLQETLNQDNVSTDKNIATLQENESSVINAEYNTTPVVNTTPTTDSTMENNLSHQKIGTSLQSLKKKQTNLPLTQLTSPVSQGTTDSQISNDESSVPNNNLSKDDVKDLLQMKQYLLDNGQKVDFEQLLRVHNNMKQNKSEGANKSNTSTDLSPLPKIDETKKNKIDELQRLTSLQYMRHMSQFKQLEQLKKIKQEKEKQEKEQQEKDEEINTHKM